MLIYQNGRVKTKELRARSKSQLLLINKVADKEVIGVAGNLHG